MSELLGRVWYHLFPLGALEAERHNPSAGCESTALSGVGNGAGEGVNHRLRVLVGLLDRLVDLGVGGLMLGPVFESETHGYDTVDPFRVDRRLGDEDDLVTLADACHERGMALALDGVFHHVGRGHPRFQEVLRDGPRSPAARWFHIDPEGAGPDGFSYADFEGHRQLVKLNHDEPEVRRWAADVIRHWADCGVDAWRLDAAYALPAPFLAELTDAARAHKAGTVFIGEVIHGDYARTAAAGHLDAVTQYELWKAVWSSVNDRNLFELAWALKRHGEMMASFRPWTFIGNHDTTRIASQLNDTRHLPHAVALLLLLPGTPAIYAGDETGAEGHKRDEEWGDDDVRRPVQPLPESGRGRDLWEIHRQLVRVRQDYPWLYRADVSVEQLANEHGVVVVSGEGHEMRLGLNLGDDDVAGPEGNLLAGAEGPDIPAHGWTLRACER